MTRPATCKRCEKPLPPQAPGRGSVRQYCSKRCRQRTVAARCERCGAAFMTTPFAVRLGEGRFCSRSCGSGARSAGPGNPNWKGGLSADNMRYRNRQKERWPEREAARAAVGAAVRAGRITRQPCEVCGATPAQGHHDDYAKPLEVRWLCRTHHDEHHARERAATRAA